MKRMPTSSIDAAVAAARAAAEGPLQPPPHVRLRPGDVEFWNSIVNARARDTWNEADLETAAALARCKADVERVQREVDSEGDVIVNSRGTPVVNPKHTLLETLTRRAVLLARQFEQNAIYWVERGQLFLVPVLLSAQEECLGSFTERLVLLSD